MYVVPSQPVLDRHSPGARAARRAMWMLLGVPVALAWVIAWSVIAKTSASVSEEERIRGWTSVVRNLPATLPFLAVIVVGFVMAVHAGRLGAVPEALRAVTAYTVALLFALLVIVMSAAEDVMRTRSATVKWMLLPGVLAITAVVMASARRAVLRPRH